MPVSQSFRQVCVLLRDGRVLTDRDGQLRSYLDDSPLDDLERRARVCGDPQAVLVAPQYLVGSEPTVLLSIFGSRIAGDVDGVWTEIDGLSGADPVVLATLREAAGVIAGLAPVPPRRPDWFTASWYDEAEGWIDAQLAALGRSRTGMAVPTKVWSLSAVLRVPCGPAAPVWFKASCRHFHAEPTLTRLVAQLLPEHAPPIVAADEDHAWLLMEDLAGTDAAQQDAAPRGLGAAAAQIAAKLQLRSLDHLDEIAAMGVPVRGLAETLRGFDEILVSSVELDDVTHDELAGARGMRQEVHDLVEALAALGLPETLVHGDLHPGNVAQDRDSLVLYDWSDAAISHPFFDLIHLTRSMAAEEADAARRSYTAPWRAAYPDVDIERGIELAAHVNNIFQMVNFEQIYRAQEDASYWEMRGVVSRTLRNLPGSHSTHT
jgi:aminoglycoside phosphotransferase (APT) family kinase protein